MWTYLNGEFIPKNEVSISPFDRGFLFGDSVYEVIPSYNNKLFLFDDHFKRLKNSLSLINIPFPDSLEDIKKFCSTKFGVKFEIMQKIHAKGKTTEPYTTLNKFEPEGDVEWNFEKFLIGKDSNVIARFKPTVKPFDENLIAAIEVALDS